ncbi:hypothetical protein lerEdw1_015166 [Lerista edwardsae]|nr:hypothetical protein lerEdw1_015166 [Lerista edwardsae]
MLSLNMVGRKRVRMQVFVFSRGRRRSEAVPGALPGGSLLFPSDSCLPNDKRLGLFLESFSFMPLTHRSGELAQCLASAWNSFHPVRLLQPKRSSGASCFLMVFISA